MPHAKSFGISGCANFSFPFHLFFKKKYDNFYERPREGVTENYGKSKAARPKTKFL